jgi:hypothetical protein
MKKSTLLLFALAFACLSGQSIFAQTQSSSLPMSLGMSLQNEKTGEVIFLKCADEDCAERQYVLSSPTDQQVLKTLKEGESFRLTLSFMNEYFDNSTAWPDRKYFHRVDGSLSNGGIDRDDLVSDLIIGTMAPTLLCFMYQQYGFCPLIPLGFVVDFAKAPFLLTGYGLYYVGLKTAGLAQDIYLENKAQVLVRTTRRMAAQLEDKSSAGEIKKISQRKFDRIKTAIEMYYP